MFIDRLLNQGATPLVERMMQFTAARAEVIAENYANIDTPDYEQKDLSLSAFQEMLQERRELRDRASPGSVGFSDLKAELLDPKTGVLFHDRQNRSLEQLTTDSASNAMRHNMYTEMLRRQLDSLKNVLKETVA
jgi:flagellar basal-body rod protein FlgB